MHAVSLLYGISLLFAVGLGNDDSESRDCDGESLIDFVDSGDDVDEIEPLPPLTLSEAKISMERLYEFVSLNREEVQQAGCSNFRDLLKDAEAVKEAIQAMRVTSTTRQSSLLRWLR